MGYYTNRLKRLARGFLGTAEPVILMYHRVAEPAVDPWGLAVSPENFAAQMRELRRTRKPVSLDHMVERMHAGTLEAGMVAITFDDAYRDVLDNAKPILEEFDIPATVFVVTGKLGEERGFWWDRLACAVLGGTLPAALPPISFVDMDVRQEIESAFQCGNRDALHMSLWSRIRVLPPDERDAATDEIVTTFGAEAYDAAPVMTETELAELTEGGLIDLGAHCVTHPSLPSLSAEEQRLEIRQSRERLEALTGTPIRRLAYPFGDYDERSIEIARDLGFDYAVSVETGPVGDPAARFRLPRHDIKNWTGEEFRHRLRWRL